MDPKSALQAMGIPREAMATTTELSKLPAIRNYITTNDCEQRRFLYLYSGKASKEGYMRAELAFYLAAKEFYLSKRRTVITDLVSLRNTVVGENEEEGLRSALDRAEVICIRNFHDKGGRCEPFTSPYDTAMLVSWFRRMHEDERIFVLHGAAPIAMAGDWWPDSFTWFVGHHGRICEVSE